MRTGIDVAVDRVPAARDDEALRESGSLDREAARIAVRNVREAAKLEHAGERRAKRARRPCLAVLVLGVEVAGGRDLGDDAEGRAELDR